MMCCRTYSTSYLFRRVWKKYIKYINNREEAIWRPPSFILKVLTGNVDASGVQAVSPVWIVLGRYVSYSLRRRNKMRSSSRTGASDPDQSRSRTKLAVASVTAQLGKKTSMTATVSRWERQLAAELTARWPQREAARSAAASRTCCGRRPSNWGGGAAPRGTKRSWPTRCTACFFYSAYFKCVIFCFTPIHIDNWLLEVQIHTLRQFLILFFSIEISWIWDSTDHYDMQESRDWQRGPKHHS